ncbi:MAG: FHA domain-containing protein [Proteobacteria bacterium]|nr:FHA domain-containing protein [Pseudomonadota bacterium]
MNFCRNCGNTLGASGRLPAMQAEARPSNLPVSPPADVVPLRPGIVGPVTVVDPATPVGPPAAPSPDAVPRVTPSAIDAPPQICPFCGARTPAGFAFCQQCGRKISTANIGPGTARHPGVISGETGGALPGASHSTAAPDSSNPTGPLDREGVYGYVPGHPVAPLEEHSALGRPDHQPTSLRLAPPPGPDPGGDARPVPHDAERVGAGARRFDAEPVARTPGREPGDLVSPSEPSPAWGQLISVNKDGSDGRRYTLRGDWVLFGRGQVDIAFSDDRFLALEHARFHPAPEGCLVAPVDTLNGVYLRVSDHMWLDDGAVILLGREVVRFELLDEEERQAAPLVRHGVALFGSPPRQPWGRLVELLASGGVLDVRHLSQDIVTIGREDGDIVFRDDAFLSRRHASLTWQDGRCRLTDLDSSNGTFVRLRGRTALRADDYLRIGDQLVRFEAIEK